MGRSPATSKQAKKIVEGYGWVIAIIFFAIALILFSSLIFPNIFP